VGNSKSYAPFAFAGVGMINNAKILERKIMMEQVEINAAVFKVVRAYSDFNSRFVYSKIKETLPDIPENMIIKAFGVILKNAE
jgi:hypothetical protein